MSSIVNAFGSGLIVEGSGWVVEIFAGDRLGVDPRGFEGPIEIFVQNQNLGLSW
jgi:hypothetical protein